MRIIVLAVFVLLACAMTAQAGKMGMESGDTGPVIDLDSLAAAGQTEPVSCPVAQSDEETEQEKKQPQPVVVVAAVVLENTATVLTSPACNCAGTLDSADAMPVVCDEPGQTEPLLEPLPEALPLPTPITELQSEAVQITPWPRFGPWEGLWP